MPVKSVLITGASKGLGKDLTKVFAKGNYKIIIHGRNNLELEKVKQSLDIRVNSIIVKGDLRQSQTIENLYSAAKENDLSILINNAGIYLNKPFLKMTEQEIREMVETNLYAPIILTKKLFPILQQQSGLIININSMAGKNPTETEAIYCATKHGLRGFTTSFRYEANREGVRVLDIYPGAMNTRMAWGRKNLEKCIQPKEVAEVIYDLATKEFLSLKINEIDLGRKKY